MRIVVFSPDLPFPPNRGGKADIWRRILAFKGLGYQVMLVNMVEISGPEAPSAADIEYTRNTVDSHFQFPIKRSIALTIRQLLGSFKTPWHAATRVPNSDEMRQLTKQIEYFKPDFLWMDGPWFGVICNIYSKTLGIPTLYRSHNIEHKYLLGQAKIAVKLRDRLAWTLVCLGLKSFEGKKIRSAAAVFDISVDDLAYWESAGVKNIHWLPPLPELAFRQVNPAPLHTDIVFLGNLGTPNNVRGVEWLITEVLPKIRARMSDVQLHIVGSNPTPFIKDLLATVNGVELCANVADPSVHLFGAKVLVNPVMSGSGVQVKMLDMLMTDAPIVTASQGTRGLPHEFRALFRVADDADSFANAICEELQNPTVDLVARAAAREVFSIGAVGRALEMVQIASQHSRDK